MTRRSTRSKCIYYIILWAVFVCCPASETTVDLDNNGKPVGCVRRGERDYSNYCLTIRHEGKPLTHKAFRCFLEQELVYECSSDRNCSAHAALRGNTVPSQVAETCSGVPFANFKNELLGRYECLLDNSTTSVYFQLDYCTEPVALLVELTRGGQQVGHVTLGQREQDDYCLEVKQDDGTPATAFQCALNGTLVYTCRSSGDCEDGGALAIYRTVPRSVSGSCSGIPFANMNNLLSGRYSCWMLTTSGENITGFTDVYPYAESSPGLKEDATEEGYTAWVATSIILCVVMIIVALVGIAYYRRCCNPDLGSPV